MTFANVRFGVGDIYVEAKGPFNDDVNVDIQNGIDPVAQLTLPGDQFPNGYNMQVCVSTSFLAV
jgi:hypothetical protein